MHADVKQFCITHDMMDLQATTHLLTLLCNPSQAGKAEHHYHGQYDTTPFTINITYSYMHSLLNFSFTTVDVIICNLTHIAYPVLFPAGISY